MRWNEIAIGVIFAGAAWWAAILLATDDSRAPRHARLLEEEQELRKVHEYLAQNARWLDEMAHRDSWTPPATSNKPPYPKVALSERVFDFGKMTVGGTAMHRFQVRNIGKARLVIYKPPTGCRWNATYWHREIEPGCSTDIEMSWTPREIDPYFAKTANYRTNDPTQSEFALKVYGKVVAEKPVNRVRPRGLAICPHTAGR